MEEERTQRLDSEASDKCLGRFIFDQNHLPSGPHSGQALLEIAKGSKGTEIVPNRGRKSRDRGKPWGGVKPGSGARKDLGKLQKQQG